MVQHDDVQIKQTITRFFEEKKNWMWLVWMTNVKLDLMDPLNYWMSNERWTKLFKILTMFSITVVGFKFPLNFLFSWLRSVFVKVGFF